MRKVSYGFKLQSLKTLRSLSKALSREVMGSIPCLLDERPEAFNRVGVPLSCLPGFAPVERLVLRLFASLVVSTRLVGVKFGSICFHKLLDKYC